MAYTVLTIIFFAVLVSLPLIFGILFASSKRKIELVRKFKKGLFVVIYIIAIPLYFMGLYHGSGDFFASLFTSITKTISLVVLSFDTAGIESLMAEEIWYSVAIYTCFALVALNTILLVSSFLSRKVWELYHKVRFVKHSKESKLLIIGNNEDNHNIYKSFKNGKAIILGDLSKEDKENLYLEDIAYISKRNKENSNRVCELCTHLLDEQFKNGNAEFVIVINTRDDRRNLEYCQAIKEVLQNAIGENNPNKELDDNEKLKVVGILSKAKIYVFGNPEYETLYNSITKDAFGCITYINKYRQIAMDLQEKYPLTEFMNESQIDYSTATIKDETKINVFLIGFGKTNHQVFLSSVANNQFLTIRDGALALKQVNYHIFDKHAPGSRKNLNHSYYRFKNEFGHLLNNTTNKGYLDLPALPSQDYFHPYDINSPNFYKCIEGVAKDVQSFNYFIIAYGSDLENIDMAQKLLEKKREWELKNAYVFVKVRSNIDAFKVPKNGNCFVFGNESDVAFSFEKIRNNLVTDMAMDRDKTYKIEGAVKNANGKPGQNKIDEAIREATFKWYKTKTEFERNSSRYAVISLRTKLHLMGLDYVPKSTQGDKVTEADYLKKYDPCGHIEYVEGIIARIGDKDKKIISYDNNFKPSLRTTLATQEHYRWNSYMISIGFIPATINQIKTEEDNGKSYELRRHGNITTMKGLVDYRNMVVKSKGKNENDVDVIRYDYQILDDAYWLLDKYNYKIIKKGSDKKEEQEA